MNGIVAIVDDRNHPRYGQKIYKCSTGGFMYDDKTELSVEMFHTMLVNNQLFTEYDVMRASGYNNKCFNSSIDRLVKESNNAFIFSKVINLMIIIVILYVALHLFIYPQMDSLFSALEVSDSLSSLNVDAIIKGGIYEI